MKRCHIFSDVSYKDGQICGVFIAGNEPPRILRFSASSGKTGLYEIKTMFKALDFAVKRFKHIKYFIVHTDVIDIEFLLKKTWFQELFGNYLDREDIEFHWEQTREYIRYKKCHILSRIAVGIYNDFQVLDNKIFKDSSL